jgi:hypothetical protein
MYWNFVAIDGVIKNQITCFVLIDVRCFLVPLEVRMSQAEDHCCKVQPVETLFLVNVVEIFEPWSFVLSVITIRVSIAISDDALSR